ncbi:oleate hydratase [Mycolicibacterium fortuitum]|jgi:oleate hydratase|uniref:Myosin-cross-reactive antigen n=1 Tax=Mycolicibacterium fortuitum subsp. fortuitum DSM 46621 = ATCC 6841 = JCM 6387 TaxID=1214102 RepID=K0V9X3_MYCFO|nr:oleate hydratase [Mycolicibacterium fortuitum]AIY44323.1 Oleate hydratase [Mycobacterium sp. VKM Ac-1817D]CRL81381.1 Oleate hydratase [Mycolicibacter nonchromogenicus]EJZ14425.1 myosin-cross-reactive antigen [Mycolicibacterium fortuitum subsp. fortuitum DSM 46621 = ATCC 6841 = JCM 6387]WEV32965.1 oleate hydratase [Mycolicibacterium fortuitum]CRL56869.1 Oleate hydratase [Mycolicibacterium fortuitum subsp. fortuitum DSM 46621 = ATCC 6841 = JCM 6387]
MYYSSGNYEAFARPRKPQGVEDKTAWFVGAGLASMSSAVFMIRDGQLPGNKITILERLKLPGGALDGIKEPKKGFVIRGGREMEDHMECLWDLFRTIPSLEIEGASVLDEFYWLNKDDPNYSLCRATENRGQDAHTDNMFGLNAKAQKDIVKVFLATREEMENKRINEVFGKDFLESNFWLYWRTMFAFEEWHSALEMKLYIHRFIHHIKGLPDLSALKFTKYNQYESLVLPMYKWLLDQGVTFHFDTEVTDIDFDITPDRKQATRIHWIKDGEPGGVDLGPNDLVLTTIGSLTENSDDGDHHTPAKLNTGPAPAWDLWRRIAAKDPSFGRPDVFGGHIPETKWESATVTTLDHRIPEYIQKICKRDPFSGKVVTGGIVTARDSKWLMSWTVNRQPHFKQQPKDQIVVWVYGLFVDTPGDYVKKPLSECTGEEITQEWLYHLGVPEADIPELAANAAKAVPVMMPYVTSFFMPRQAGDRPAVVPEGAVNFAFIGQFAETTRDCIFTTEYSVRTGMEAAYQLLGIDRGVPEVFNSTYDVRKLISGTVHLRDGKEVDLPVPEIIRKRVMGKITDNEIGELLAEYGLIPGNS